MSVSSLKWSKCVKVCSKFMSTCIFCERLSNETSLMMGISFSWNPYHCTKYFQTKGGTAS